MGQEPTNRDRKKQGWKQNPAEVQRDILKVAISVFAEFGLSGARIDEIAARTKTSKRMIYYYFEDKETLYTRALEAAYSKVREGEAKLDLAGLSPDRALAELVAFTFEHHRRNPDFIRMVMIENIHNAEHMRNSEVITKLNAVAIDKLVDIIARGQASGLFRQGIDPVRLHWRISAFSVFNVSNRPTFSALFGEDLFSPEGQEELRGQLVDMILLSVRNFNDHPKDETS